MCNTWDFLGKYGWSHICFLEHYQCESVAPKDTKAVQISDTPKYQHHYLTQPTLTPEYHVLHGLQTLTYALEYATIQMCDEQLRAISTLHEIFRKWTKNVPTYPRRNKAPRAPPKKPPEKGEKKPTINIGNIPPDHLPHSPAQAPRVQFMQTPPNSAPWVYIIPPPDTTNITETNTENPSPTTHKHVRQRQLHPSNGPTNQPIEQHLRKLTPRVSLNKLA